ncbi:MAG: PAS domain S-box protein [Candidatus Moranbacteria bacterium]|nr:PAS domain S-box protein [Candidatus Moranbacteria bacterium]MDD3964577.1 PAS domain S-box protein [Candidatus Moranbacteria bacterium]
MKHIDLNATEALFEQVFLQSSLSTQILDSNGWCERINPKLSELFGVQPEALEGKVYNIFKDEMLKQAGVLPELHKVFDEGISTEWEILFDIGVAAESQNIQVKEKKKRWFHNWAFPILDQNGKVSHVIIQHTDITQKKKDEDNLALSEKRMRSYFNTPLYGVAITSPGKKWLEVNDALCTLLGYAREEILATTWEAMTYPDDIAPDVALFNQVMAGEIDQYTLNKRFIHKNMSVIWVKLSILCVKKEDNTIDYVVATIEDITERKKTEEAFKERNEEVEKMNSFMMNREIKMIDLKNEIAQMKIHIAELERKDETGAEN